MTEHNLMGVVKQMKNLIIADPLSYIDSMSIMESASMVLTDSGGIQEETTFLGIPCLTLRNNTERPVTVTEGTNQLIGTTPERIVDSAMEILRTGGKKGKTPKLWDGRAAERIVKVMLEQFPLHRT